MTDLSHPKAVSLKSKVSPQEWAMRVDVAACYRLVALFGMNDLVYNHISGRVPGEEATSSSTPTATPTRKSPPRAW